MRTLEEQSEAAGCYMRFGSIRSLHAAFSLLLGIKNPILLSFCAGVALAQFR